MLKEFSGPFLNLPLFNLGFLLFTYFSSASTPYTLKPSLQNVILHSKLEYSVKFTDNAIWFYIFYFTFI